MFVPSSNSEIERMMDISQNSPLPRAIGRFFRQNLVDSELYHQLPPHQSSSHSHFCIISSEEGLPEARSLSSHAIVSPIDTKLIMMPDL